LPMENSSVRLMHSQSAKVKSRLLKAFIRFPLSLLQILNLRIAAKNSDTNSIPIRTISKLRKVAREREKKRQKKMRNNKKKKKKKKKLRTTGDGEEGGKKRIVSWRLRGPSCSYLPSLSVCISFSSLSLSLSYTLLLFISVPPSRRFVFTKVSSRFA